MKFLSGRHSAAGLCAWTLCASTAVPLDEEQTSVGPVVEIAVDSASSMLGDPVLICVRISNPNDYALVVSPFLGAEFVNGLVVTNDRGERVRTERVITEWSGKPAVLRR